MSVSQLLQELSARGVKLQQQGDQLKIRAPKGALTAELRQRLADEKPQILDWFEQHRSDQESLPTITPDLNNRYQPFPLTDIQQAYWIGSCADLEMGGGYHYYLEFDCNGLDAGRLNRAWQQLIQRHDMLRAIVLPDGQQQVQTETPDYPFQIHDLTQASELDQQTRLEQLRQTLSHRHQILDQWPLFDIQVSQLATDHLHLHVSLGLIVLDSGSMMILFREWEQLYQNPQIELPPLSLSFRDYVLAERQLEQTRAYQRAKAYWLERLPALPPAPQLPLAATNDAVSSMPNGNQQTDFIRLTKTLEKSVWQSLKQHATQLGVTPSAMLLTAFSQVLASWSEQSAFTLNLTLFNRLPIDSQINDIVGDFTSVTLLAVDFSKNQSFIEHALSVNRQLQQDLEHRHYPGIRVLREWGQWLNHSGRPLAPVVFSSTLVLNQPDDFSLYRLFGGDLCHAISQTPQLHLDHQLLEDDGRLIFHWDVVQGFYPDGMVDDMFQAYTELLEQLAEHESIWQQTAAALVPVEQLASRSDINHTDVPLTNETLTSLFLQQVDCQPDKTAVVSGSTRLSYRELQQRSSQIAIQLKQHGVQHDTLVPIIMHKGWEQIVAVFAVLLSGAAYVPIDPTLPEKRRKHLIEQAFQGDLSRILLSQSQVIDALSLTTTNHSCIAVDQQLTRDPIVELVDTTQPQHLAYVIYTSGSTGVPKGVMIEHRSVVNRMQDVAQRFELTSDDSVLALTALHHDLSIFDMFGMLCCAGGSIVIPAAEQSRDPIHWQSLMVTERVSLWNSVPAFMEMLVTHLEHQQSLGHSSTVGSLRWSILSGDFIPASLPNRIKALIDKIKVVSAGGPTETTVWDICYPIEKVDINKPSIPYGRPMRNARYFVLKDNLQPCPVWTPGELYIAGTGLARGYWQDQSLTERVFILHPDSGERLYRSGDMGRYLPDGNIEIMQRRDFQVKIQGQRIELGEIESVLNQHPDVKQAVVTVANDDHSSHQQLIAHIVSDSSETPANKNTTIDDYTLPDSVSSGDRDSALLNAIDRLEFKLKQSGVIPDEAISNSIFLPQSRVDESSSAAQYLARQSHRQFINEALSFEGLADLLSCLQQRAFEQAPLPKYRYPSAGSLYPVRTYLHIKPGRVANLPGGCYYYHPGRHALVSVHQESMDESLYGGVNSELFKQAGFSIFLVANFDAIKPMYPGVYRDFCLLEAGYMSQLLMQQADQYLLGLCPAGNGVNIDLLNHYCGLESQHELVHTLVGGAIEPTWQQQWMEYSEIDQNKGNGVQTSIEQYARDYLPAHMLPVSYQLIAELPLTINGKVDRQALTDRARSTVTTTKSASPATQTEQQVAQLLEEMLNIDEVNILQPFFDMGANSVTLVQLRNRLQELWQRNIPMADIFGLATVKQLANYLSPNDEPSITDVSNDHQPSATVLPAQELDQMAKRAHQQKAALARRRQQKKQ